jgi:hypothetical protein
VRVSSNSLTLVKRGDMPGLYAIEGNDVDILEFCANAMVAGNELLVRVEHGRTLVISQPSTRVNPE